MSRLGGMRFGCLIAVLAAVPAIAATAPRRFVHPGILVNRGQLDFVKARLAARAEPWKSAFDRVRTDPLAASDYTPSPFATVECGPYSKPNIGCESEIRDATAAYTQALLWYYTGEKTYLTNAIAIMNAWSAVLKEHTNFNAPLQAAWVAEMFPRAAEIVRHTSHAWPRKDADRFGKMLREVYLPAIVGGSTFNGNWELSMIDGALAIAVFNDDRPTFDRAIAMWRQRVPAFIYLTSDGPRPVPPPGGGAMSPEALIEYWQKQSTFMDGLSQETCRDLGHVGMGFASIVNAAETARIQGVDLYTEEANRITAGLELHAQYMNGAPVPPSLCGGTLKIGDETLRPTFEIAYNAYANRLRIPLPNVKALLPKLRPMGTKLQMAWETLTHAEIGAAGLP